MRGWMMKEQTLFGEIERFSWDEEWEDMPEFNQKDLTSHRKIIVHFRDDDDVDEFAKLMEQRINMVSNDASKKICKQKIYK